MAHTPETIEDDVQQEATPIQGPLQPIQEPQLPLPPVPPPPQEVAGEEIGAISTESLVAEKIPADLTKLADIQTGLVETQKIGEEIQAGITTISEEQKAAEDLEQKITQGKASGGLTKSEASAIFGTDFTGLQLDSETGLFFPDSVALERVSTEAEELIAQESQLDADFNAAINELDALRTSVSTATNALILSIQEDYQVRRNQMRDINKRQLESLRVTSIRFGGRFTPISTAGFLAEEERVGIARIAELDAEEFSLIALAEAAATEQDFRLLSEKINLIELNRQNKQREIDRLREASVAQANLIAEEQTRVFEETSIANLMGMGITDTLEIFNRLSGQVSFEKIGEIVDQLLPEGIDAEDLSPGLAGQFEALKASGEIPDDMNYFEFIRKKEEAETLPGEAKPVGGDVGQFNALKASGDLPEGTDYFEFLRQQAEAERKPAGPDDVFTLGDTEIEKAINVSLQSLKFPTVAAKNDAVDTMEALLTSGDEEGAKEFLGVQVRNSASSTQQDVFDGNVSQIDVLERIRVDLAEFIAKGGDTGFFTGLKEKALEKVGGTLSGELATIANSISASIIDYRRAVSGAAFTESEAKAYDAIYPSIGKTEELNEAKISSLIAKFEFNRQAFVQSKIGERNYNTIFGAPVETTDGAVEDIDAFLDSF